MGKKSLSLLLALMLITLTACGTQTQEQTTGDAAMDSTPASSVVQEETEYQVQSLDFYRDNRKISGELLLPDMNTPMPLVILSHGFGGNRSNVREYAEVFARHGIAAYIFDFIGGGRNIRSDGKTTEMSVLTEAADLNAILDGLKSDERFDPEKIYLFGESQGGFVSTYVAGERSDDVAGLVALYPAYVLQDNCREMTPDPDNIPETMNLMGTTIGSIYNRDAMSFDIYDQMKAYDGKVLIIHGTSDSIAPISYSERAAETFPDAKLIKYDGANHGFYGRTQENAASDSLDFIKELLNERSSSNDETKPAAQVDAISSATLNLNRIPDYQGNPDSNILVAYFSTNDTVRGIAVNAAEVLNADLFEILPEDPYTEEDINYHLPGNRAGEEQRSGARPAIVSMPDSFEQYDTILLGYPIWGGQAPNILYTFLESADLKDVTIIPFCTSNMVPAGTSAINLAKVTDPSVSWMEAHRIAGGSSEEEIRDWAASLSPAEVNKEMKMIIGDTTVPVQWEQNESVEALRAIVTEKPLTIQMSMYGGFEQVGPIGQSLPRNDKQTTTSSGDIVLYSGNQIVVFYGSNSWAYTRLGHIDLSRQEMTDLLSNGDITITISED